MPKEKSAWTQEFLTRLNPSGKENLADLDEAVKFLMDFHPWDEDKVEKAAPIRKAIGEAYKAIIINVKASPARTRALNALTDARMLAHTALTFDGAF
jgi:hypothetical protein